MDNTRIEVLKLCFLSNFEVLPLLFSATMRRTAAYDHYILISERIWVGSGSISLKGTMRTSALVPVLTSVVQTPPTARWGKSGVHPLDSLLKGNFSQSSLCLFFAAAEPLQHVEPWGVCLALLCSSGLGAPHHLVLRGSLPKSGAALQHGR